MAESFFATLECELLMRSRFKTVAEAQRAVFSFIEGWYNPRRRHSALGYFISVRRSLSVVRRHREVYLDRGSDDISGVPERMGRMRCVAPGASTAVGFSLIGEKSFPSVIHAFLIQFFGRGAPPPPLRSSPMSWM